MEPDEIQPPNKRPRHIEEQEEPEDIADVDEDVEMPDVADASVDVVVASLLSPRRHTQACWSVSSPYVLDTIENMIGRLCEDGELRHLPASVLVVVPSVEAAQLVHTAATVRGFCVLVVANEKVQDDDWVYSSSSSLQAAVFPFILKDGKVDVKDTRLIVCVAASFSKLCKDILCKTGVFFSKLKDKRHILELIVLDVDVNRVWTKVKAALAPLRVLELGEGDGEVSIGAAVDQLKTTQQVLYGGGSLVLGDLESGKTGADVARSTRPVPAFSRSRPTSDYLRELREEGTQRQERTEEWKRQEEQVEKKRAEQTKFRYLTLEMIRRARQLYEDSGGQLWSGRQKLDEYVLTEADCGGDAELWEFCQQMRVWVEDESVIPEAVRGKFWEWCLRRLRQATGIVVPSTALYFAVRREEEQI